MTGSFKQQCPSCEALVLVKDSKQIGKKVDCPRCKYRFVVEAPAEEAAAESGKADGKEEAVGKPKSSQAVTAKKPTTPGGPGVKKKAGPRKPGEEDGVSAKKKKQQNSSSLVLILGIGMSFCAVALLAIGGYFIFLAPKEDTGRIVLPTGPRTTLANRPSTEPAKKAGPTFAELTNLLPNDTQGILHFNIKDLVHGAVGRAAFETPGAFKYPFVEQHFGLRAKDVDRVLIGQNFSKDTVFAAIRTAQPINLEELKKNLNLQAGSDSPYRGQEYFTAAPSEWLDQLGRLLGDYYPVLKLAPPLRLRAPAFRIVDGQTLIVADLDPLKAFLDAKGQPSPAAPPATVKETPGRPPAPAVGNTYLGVNPELKTLIEQMEGKGSPLLCFAWEVEPIRERMQQAADLLRPTGLADEKLTALLGDLRVAGAALHLRDTTMLTFGLGGREDGFAKSMGKQLQSQAEALSQKGTFANDRVRVELDGRPLLPTAVVPPMPPGVNRAPPDVKVMVRTAPVAKVLVVNVEIQFHADSNSKVIQDFLQPRVLVLRGLTEMVGAPSRLHELAAATLKLAQKDGAWPRGVFERAIDGKRLGRPYPPNEKISWMAALLPYLGQEDVYKRIKLDQSWKSDPNAAPGSVLIPAFVDASAPSHTWWVQPPYPGGRRYGATHFVGIAGVGPDAPEYAADDPTVATKIGPLGYDRPTTVADIKDGTSHTILMLQVPPTYKRPWIAGGGATLMGVPETNSIRPFVGVHGKERGTYAIMADGSVRFISEKISDAAFQAMCTINGGEKVNLDQDAPSRPAPGAELKTQP